MNKDQFWDIIDDINQSGPFADEDGYKECVLNTLFPCSFEDLLDWHHSPGNIAHFLGNHRFADHIAIEDRQDNFVLDSDGCYIWYCRDDQLRAEIEKTLAPIQWNEVKSELFFCPEYWEVKPYLEQQADMSEPQGQTQPQMQL